MKRKTPGKMNLSRETLHNLEPHTIRLLGAKALVCSVQICPQFVASYEPCSGGCSQSSCGNLTC
jgi:hypothetical protein